MDQEENDTDSEVVIPSITHYNPMEEAAQRYWRASRIWREKKSSNWSFGAMIQELRELYCYRGLTPLLAQVLLDDVIHDRRQEVLILQLEQRASNDAIELHCA